MKLTHLNPYRLQELRQSLHSVYDHSVYAEPVAFKPIDTFRILSYCSVMHVFMPQNLPAKRIPDDHQTKVPAPVCRIHLDGHVLILRYLVDIAHSLQIASPPKNWRPQDLHLYKCFRPLTPFLTTSEEPQKKHFFKHINDNLRKDI